MDIIVVRLVRPFGTMLEERKSFIDMNDILLL